MTEQVKDQAENQNGAEATCTKFFCSVSGDEGFEKVIHSWNLTAK